MPLAEPLDVIGGTLGSVEVGGTPVEKHCSTVNRSKQ